MLALTWGGGQGTSCDSADSNLYWKYSLTLVQPCRQTYWLDCKTKLKAEVSCRKLGNWKGTTQKACKFHKSVCTGLMYMWITLFISKRKVTFFFFFFWVTFNIFRNQINTSYEQETGSRLGIHFSFWFQSTALPDLINNIKNVVILNRRLCITCLSKSCFMLPRS